VVNRSVTIVGAGGGAFLETAAMAPTVTVAPGIDAALDYLTITGPLGPAISCTTGSLRVYGVTLAGNQQGIISTGCSLTVEHSAIKDNPEGALDIAGGAIDIRNNFISGNGGPLLKRNANVAIAAGATGAFTFNTITHNDAKQNGTPAVECRASGLRLEGNLITENTIRRSPSTKPEIAGTCVFDGSLVTQGQADDTMRWANASAGNFHLTTESTAALGQATLACPSDDIDSDPRPSEACDYGADELKR
jgi:hypothetical protein